MFTTLMYHLVDDAIATPMSVPSRKFTSQMKWLAGSGVTLLTQTDVNAILDRTQLPPAKGVFLTFDDGYRNTITDVMPVLDRYGIPASIAVCSSYLLPRFSPLKTVHHSQDFASAPELMAWLAGGRAVAGHTYDHPYLTKLSAADLRLQIAADKMLLEDILEIELDTFLYPFGAVDGAVAAMAAEYYPTAFSIFDGAPPSPDNRHRITRLFVDPNWSQPDFETAVTARLLEDRS